LAAWFPVLRMEVEAFSETSITIIEATQHHIAEDSNHFYFVKCWEDGELDHWTGSVVSALRVG
jgi:hypothetical protein